jgi:hypothetical protein
MIWQKDAEPAGRELLPANCQPLGRSIFLPDALDISAKSSLPCWCPNVSLRRSLVYWFSVKRNVEGLAERVERNNRGGKAIGATPPRTRHNLAPSPKLTRPRQTKSTSRYACGLRGKASKI